MECCRGSENERVLAKFHIINHSHMIEVSKSGSPTVQYSVLRTLYEILSAFSEILQPSPITKTSSWPVLLVYLNYFYR